jgi:hypothetical protein
MVVMPQKKTREGSRMWGPTSLRSIAHGTVLVISQVLGVRYDDARSQMMYGRK